MVSLVIHDMDDALHARLQEAAVRHRRSLEEEVRELLRAAVARQASAASEETLVALARRLFGSDHGVELDIPPRGSAPVRPPLDFSAPEWAHLEEPSHSAPVVSPRTRNDPA